MSAANNCPVVAVSVRDLAAGIYGNDCLDRLLALAGLGCPDCGELLVFDGSRLCCANGLRYGATCFNTWNNPDAAEADILGNSPQ